MLPRTREFYVKKAEVMCDWSVTLIVKTRKDKVSKINRKIADLIPLNTPEVFESDLFNKASYDHEDPVPNPMSKEG